MTTTNSNQTPAPETDPKPGIEYARLRVRDLQLHPKYAELFAPRSEAEDRGLAASFLKWGQDDPVDILPDRQTIIVGRGQHAAAEINGWESITVRIRHDLGAAGESAVEAFMISRNLYRRNASQLERVRCAKRLFEIEDAQMSAAPGKRRRLTARDVQRRVGELLGISDRQVRRLLRVLETPPEVQAAFEAGKLHVDLAGRVASLPRDIQSFIADDIAAGQDPKTVINDYIAQRESKRGEQWALYKIADFLNRGHSLLDATQARGDLATKSEASLLRKAKDVAMRLADRLAEFRDTETADKG